MDDDVKKWLRAFKRVMNKKPNTIELVIDNSSIGIYETGTLREHMASENNTFGLGYDKYITSIPNDYFEPYTEGQ